MAELPGSPTETTPGAPPVVEVDLNADNDSTYGDDVSEHLPILVPLSSQITLANAMLQTLVHHLALIQHQEPHLREWS